MSTTTTESQTKTEIKLVMKEMQTEIEKVEEVKPREEEEEPVKEKAEEVAEKAEHVETPAEEDGEDPDVLVSADEEAKANESKDKATSSDAKDSEESDSDAELPVQTEFKSEADLELRQSSHTLQPVRPVNPMDFRRENMNKQPSLSQRVSAQLSVPNPEHYKCKIYVKELLGSTTKKDIFELFGKFARIIDISIRPDMAHPGCVSCRLQYETEADALRLLVHKEEIMQNGHRLQIAQGVRPKSRIFSSQSIILPDEPRETKLFVGGFDISVTEEQLVKFFNHYLQRKGGDSVKNFKMIYDKRTGISRCFGFVTILNSEEQVRTLLKNKYISCYGKQIEIKSVDAELASGARKKIARREPPISSSRIRLPSRPSMFSMSDLAYERRRNKILSYEEAQAYYRNLQRRRSGYVEGIYSAEMIESYRRRRSKHISKDLMRQMKERMESSKVTI